jgi:hypothetical protein
MASELKVDKFTGVTTAGSILVTGEGNSTTTNLQQGLAKAWSFVNQNDGSPAFADSFNCSSLADEATGRTFNNLTNNMSSANFATGGKVTAINISCVETYRTFGVRYRAFNSSFSETDLDSNTLSIHGDLA